ALRPALPNQLHTARRAATHLTRHSTPTATYSADVTITVSITLQHPYGSSVSFPSTTLFPSSLALSGGDPTATLGGTNPKNAVAGSATHTYLPQYRVGTAYQLPPSSSTLTPAASSRFNITHGAATQRTLTTKPRATYPPADPT